MKTRIKELVALFALATMVVGCQKDAIEDSMIIPSGGIMVASPYEGGTRVSETPNADNALGYKVSWEVGDKLYVSDEEGDTLIGVYEVKNAASINSDGSAIFQAKDESTPLLDASAKYQFLATDADVDESYNDYLAATWESYRERWEDVTDANNLVTSLLYSKSALSVGSTLSLSHYFSYVRIGAKIVDATNPKVMFSYRDDEQVNYTYTLSLDKFDSSLIEDDTYTFNMAILPATIPERYFIRLDVAADGETYSTQKELVKDTKFEAGVHYDFSYGDGDCDDDDELAPDKNEIIVDGVAKPITGCYYDFDGEYYACRLSSSHSSQLVSYPFNSWTDLTFTNYKEHLFEMKVSYENTGELDFDLANPDFTPYHHGMMIESTFAGKSNGEAVEGVELMVDQAGSMVAARYIPNLRDADYLDYKYNEESTSSFTPTPATIKSGRIRSRMIMENPEYCIISLICDVTLTVEFEIGGVIEQRTFTITSNGGYVKEPIDESKFNNTVSLNGDSRGVKGAIVRDMSEGEMWDRTPYSYTISADLTNEELFNGDDSQYNDNYELGRYIHGVYTNLDSFKVNSDDPSTCETLEYGDVSILIQSTGGTNLECYELHVEGGGITIGGFSLPEHGTGLVTYIPPTLHKCSFEFNKDGDKISYKMYLDITTTTMDEVDHHQIITAEYAGTPEGVPVTGVEVYPEEMELMVGKDKERVDYRIEPYDAKNQNVTVTSSDDSVASVEKSVYDDPYMGTEFVEYYVVPHKEGTATITVTSEDGGYTAECEVTVIPSKIDVTPREKIVAGSGESFTVELTTDEEWIVSQGEQYIDESQHSGTGNATITITIPENTSTYEQNIPIVFDTKDRSDDVMIDITQPVCTTIDDLFINYPTLHLNVGEEDFINTSTLPSYMSRSGEADDYEWSSSDTSVVTLADFEDWGWTKYVKAEGVGTATITAKYLGHTVTCEVIVDNVAKPIYKVGDLYPDAVNPVGVVFEVEEPNYGMEFVEGTRGKVVSLNRPDTDPDLYKKWELRYASDGVLVPELGAGMFNMIEVSPDFDGYPAAKWCHELNVAQGRDVNNYALGTKYIWRLPEDKYDVETMLWRKADLLESVFVSVKGPAPDQREGIRYDYSGDYEHYFTDVEAMICSRYNSTSAYIWEVGSMNGIQGTRNMLHIYTPKVVLAVMEF